MSTVVWIDSCPSRRWITGSGIPAAISAEAWEWRRSCTRGRGSSPAAFTAGCQQRVWNGPDLTGPPLSVVNSRPLPDLPSAWARRTGTSGSGTDTVRTPRRVFGAPT